MEVDVEKMSSADEVAAWLRTKLTVRGLDPEKVRFVPSTKPDLEANEELLRWPPSDRLPAEFRSGLLNGRWWHVSVAVDLQVRIDLVGLVPQWLTLGRHVVGGVVEGQVPGAEFQLIWEDAHGLWLEMAESAVDQAAQTLATLAPVELRWAQDDATPNVVGDRPIQEG